MTGWRVGWIRVPRRLVSQFLKVQDYSIICASHPGQIVALNAMRIMKQTGVCVMPGSIFGKAWTSWFRISYGTAEIDQLMESVRRIVSYFENY